MAKAASDDGSGHADTGAYTVFLDSNLDTHLAMNVSVQDTVRDLKDKIMIDHPCHFPNIGEIIVNALKVKHKGCFYHLSDSVSVKSVFNGSMKMSFLQFDASHQGERKENTYHLKPGASYLPSHVFTRDGPLAETNTLRLVRPSKDVSILDVPPVPQVGSRQPRDIFPHSSDDKEKLKNANSERLSTRLLKDDRLFPQNSSNDKQKPKNADSEGLSIRLPKDDPFLSLGNKKKRKKKKKPSSPYDQVDYDIPSGYNVWEEPSEVALENSHGDLRGEIDAALAPEQTNVADHFVGFDMGKPGTSKMDRRDTSDYIEATRGRKSKSSKKHQAASVEGLNLPVAAEPGNLTKDGKTLVYDTVCCDNNNVDDVRGETSEVALENSHRNLGEEFDAALAPEQTDAGDPFVDIDRHKPGISKIERTDTSDHIEASRGRISKRSRKHQAVCVEGLDLPRVAELGNLTKDNTTLVSENVCCDNNVGDDVSKKTSEVALENNLANLGGEFDAALAPEQTDAAGPFVDVKFKPVTSNMERRDTSDHVEASEGRKSKRSKKHQAASVEGLNLPVVVESGNAKDSTILAHENFCHDINDGDDDKTGVIEKEEKALLQDECPKPMPSEAPTSKLKSMGLRKTEMDSKDVVISSKLLQSSAIARTGDPGDKRRKKSKKSRDSDQPSSVGIEDANGVRGAIPLNPELDKAFFSDHPSEKHDTLFQNEKAKVSKVGTVNTPLTDLDKEPDDACQNEVNFVPPIQVNKIQEAEGGSVYKLKRKSRKTESSAKNLPDPMAGKQDVSTEDPALSSDEKKGKNIRSQNAKKTRLGKKGPTNPLADSMSEAEKDIGSKVNCSKPCSIPGTNEPSEVPSDIFVCNIDRPPHEADISDDKGNDKGDNHMKVLKFESDKISCTKNFEPSQRKHEVAPVKDLVAKDVQIERSDKELPSNKKTKKHPKFESDKICHIKIFEPSQRRHEVAPGIDLGAKDVQIARSDKELPSNKKRSKHNVHSLGTSPGLQKSFNSHDSQEFKEKPRNDSFDTVKLQEPISKTKKGEPMPNTPNRKTSTTAGDRVKDSTSCYHENCDSIPREASKTKIVDASGTNSPVHSSMVQFPFRAGDNAFEKESSVDWDASGSSWESRDVGVLKNIQGRKLKSRSKYNPVTAGKASSKKTGEVFNNFIPEKRLFATSGTIFKDSSSDSSEDEGEINNSDTSTKSPSDGSSPSSSDYLERTNHSPQNGNIYLYE
ncbi:uncharacterized protein LOC122655657 [Telopea speciosissima]|uniref:uncharacterized protein LOC122655657 n=1 Tax=Telopea speciosissima TaxID=54955 RepID=UPI001CC5586C|nr:uncharacterized protein LOC122655657 [Telopea speciosissima]